MQLLRRTRAKKKSSILNTRKLTKRNRIRKTKLRAKMRRTMRKKRKKMTSQRRMKALFRLVASRTRRSLNLL